MITQFLSLHHIYEIKLLRFPMSFPFLGVQLRNIRLDRGDNSKLITQDLTIKESIPAQLSHEFQTSTKMTAQAKTIPEEVDIIIVGGTSLYL
jgi:hypothetical protein